MEKKIYRVIAPHAYGFKRVLNGHTYTPKNPIHHTSLIEAIKTKVKAIRYHGYVILEGQEINGKNVYNKIIDWNKATIDPKWSSILKLLNR